ncbi:MAG: hypothetical protein KDI19_00085 [Pseudomonadales bacterium]|nr:hypothetical protein [Pseudomonadales bacterium]
MKKIAAFVFALSVAAGAQADNAKIVGDQRFVASGDNVYSQLCMAALESKYVLEQRAEELGVSKSDMKDVTCNGLSLVRFAKTYRGDIQQWFIAHRD